MENETDFDYVGCPHCQTYQEVGALFDANAGEAIEGYEGLTVCPDCGEASPSEDWLSE